MHTALFPSTSVKMLQQSYPDILGVRKWILDNGKEGGTTFLIKQLSILY